MQAYIFSGGPVFWVIIVLGIIALGVLAIWINTLSLRRLGHWRVPISCNDAFHELTPNNYRTIKFSIQPML